MNGNGGKILFFWMSWVIIVKDMIRKGGKSFGYDVVDLSSDFSITSCWSEYYEKKKFDRDQGCA
jgi:hypothetical protein